MPRVARPACLVGLVLAATACWVACDDNKPSCAYSLSKASATLPAAGGSDTVMVSVTSGGKCAWTAASSAPWLTVTPASGTGDGSVSFSASANDTAARSAVLTIAGQAVTVTQGGLPPPTYTLSGRVTDAFLGFPPGSYGLPAVTVTATGPSQGTATTDSSGNYAIDDLLAGAYSVTFAKAGYVTLTATVTMSGSTTLPASLAPATVPASTSDLTGTWSGTGTYPNDPFKLTLVQDGTELRGNYVDQHDSSLSVGGTYTGASFTLRVDFGDAVLFLDCTVDNARQVSGVQRTSALGNRSYPFTMTR